MQEGDRTQMVCPAGNIEGDWRLTYFGTVTLDDTSARVPQPHKYFLPLL